ncbi:MAG: Mov34/MPN/PAD-1 family protein [Candidatus Aminicenantes bacterium]|nr:Mov34/MPN/PAD-1 family protein [Candidatus Aminicenantes bacterium]
MVDVPYWIFLANRYANEHPAILSVSEIKHLGDEHYTFTAEFRVNLPGKFDIIGQTERGVRKKEPVKFIFPPSFPYKAPFIYLRDDFCRNFAHINPSKEKVTPCIFYGNLNELLQQPKWFDHILDQMADWLEKAAGNNLIDYKQGWEPMRSDELKGEIFYDKGLIDKESEAPPVFYNNFPVFAYVFPVHSKLKEFDSNKHSTILIFKMPIDKISDNYIPNYISKFSDLCEFAEQNHINHFRDRVNRVIKKLKKLFVILVIRRPSRLINSSSCLEALNFGIRIKRNSKTSKIKSNSEVYFLSHRDVCNLELLNRFSGNLKKQRFDWIFQIGCGSLGSKICVHLARNGNNNFVAVDKSKFSPHNNARHSLINRDIRNINKAFLLKHEIDKMGINVRRCSKDVQFLDFSKFPQSIIIDSTANLAVRNYLSRKSIPYPIVHTSLYNHGKLAILLAESSERNPRLDDLIVFIFSECLRNKCLRESLLTEQAVRMSTGQGCGSFTTVVPDSRISLAAAGMSAKIQTYISSGVPENGEVLYGVVGDDDMGIRWNKIKNGKVLVVEPKDSEYEIRVFPKIAEIMDSEAKKHSPNETGGVLVGHISLINKCITISDLILAPEDSIETPNYFELGTSNLLNKIKEIEKKSNTLLTYLGTWHSHPHGGDASNLDKETKKKIKELRNYMPTVCLIWTQNGLLSV